MMEFDPKIQSRWKIALFSGAVSVWVLFSNFALEHVGFLVLPVSILGSLVGLVLGVLSIVAKEKQWFFAVPAIVLALVCPFHVIASLLETSR